MQRASLRLAIVVPLALFLIFVLLYTMFNSVRPAVLIYLNIPLAATGGILALAFRGMPFSISAGIGFIALFGVAVLNGVVLMSYVLDLQKKDLSAEDAAYQGALIRVRPVLMSALVVSLGFVPMALSTSAGAEVQRSFIGYGGYRRPCHIYRLDPSGIAYSVCVGRTITRCMEPAKG